jgi:hypothetical protein
MELRKVLDNYGVGGNVHRKFSWKGEIYEEK